jgi:hypothetical protein
MKNIEHRTLNAERPVERMPFFITGLPRSRTAWLAAWLSADALCLHDIPAPREGARPAGTAGYSGPELATQYDELRAKFPSSKWLVVVRELADAIRSFKEWAGPLIPRDFDLERFFTERAEALNRIDGLRVDFTALSDINTGRAIWEYLKPWTPFDASRFFFFDQLNIQQRRPSWL